MSKVKIRCECYEIFVRYVYLKRKLGKQVAQDHYREFYRKLTDTGVRKVTFWPYVVENKGLYNWCTPWYRVKGDEVIHVFLRSGAKTEIPIHKPEDKGKWDFNQPNKRYWKNLLEFAIFTRKCGILLIPVLFAERYMDRMFQKGENVNDVGHTTFSNGLWSDSVKKYQLAYCRKLMRTLRRAYKIRRLWCRLSNEVGHGGDWIKGVHINWRHQAWQKAINKWVPISRTVFDTSHSDFAQLSEAHYLYRKAGGGWGMCPVDSYVGDPGDIIYTFGDDKYGRKGWVELHGCELASLDEMLGKANGNKWKKWIFSTDGSTRGSGYQIPGTPFTDMTPVEIKEFASKCWSQGITIEIAELPKHILRRNDDGVIELMLEELDESMFQAYKEVS